MSNSGAKMLTECIKKVATGYEFSRALTRAEARDAMAFILDGDADDVQAAVFLIALRMKRETMAENLGLQDAIVSRLSTAQVELPILLALSDPYDGLLRSVPVSTFLPATLAACGLPSFSHGVYDIGPKFGVTHGQVLSALGYNSDADPAALAELLRAQDVGWAFVNMDNAYPEWANLKNLRNRMIKRTALATLERTHRPFQASGKTILLTGHVHSAYPSIYLELARNAGYDGAATYKGYEGGVIPALHQSINFHNYIDDGDDLMRALEPDEMQISGMLEKAPDDKQSVQALIASSMEALAGQKNAAYNSLVLSGSLALLASGLETSTKKAAQRVRQGIDSGAARAHFERGLERNHVAV